VQDLSPLDRGGGGPGRERLVRSDHGRVELLGGWQSEGDERLFGGRVLDGQGVALAGDLLTADEQPGLQAV
jgi:hypothetical protein